MTNYIIAADLPPSFHQRWLNSIAMKMNGKIWISELRIYEMKVFTEDEKKLLECLQTYNGLDHWPNRRKYNPNMRKFENIFLFFRKIFGLGNIPLTPKDNAVPTPGHVLILGRIPDLKVKRDGKEFEMR